MGLLSSMLNPLSITKDALKKTKQVFHGDIKGALTGGTDPGSMLFRSAVGSPKSNPATNDVVDSTQSNYGGDSSDPAYGSFTQPFDVEQFYKYEDPGYAFRLQQGQQGVQNRNSAGSGALSGAAYKDLIDYNQNSASQEYGNAFGRYQTQQNNIFSRLSDIAHLGQAGAAGVGAQGTQLAGNAGQFTSNAGTAEGSGIVGGANALTDGATNAWLWSQLNKPPGGAGKGINSPV